MEDLRKGRMELGDNRDDDNKKPDIGVERRRPFADVPVKREPASSSDDETRDFRAVLSGRPTVTTLRDMAMVVEELRRRTEHLPDSART